MVLGLMKKSPPLEGCPKGGVAVLCFALLLFGCADTDVERNNPYDERAINYVGRGDEPSSSSSSAPGSSSSIPDFPSSSSSEYIPSSSSSAPSSSSSNTPSSSSSTTPSSSSSSSSAGNGSSSSSQQQSSSSSVLVASNCEGMVGTTVTIGTQTWMNSNLNCNVSGSKCYGDDDSNCATYGRLYNWETAKTVCPSGWHLPTQEEWNTLSSYVQSNSGCSSCDARLLKSTSGWNNNGNGTDSYGFSALPGGYGGSGGSFGSVGSNGSWWSASEYDSNSAYYRYMYYYYEDADWNVNYKSYLFSVRCLQD